MKFTWFHMQGYRDLPQDFEKRFESVWVNPPTDELCDPKKIAQYLNWNLDELDYAAKMGYDGVGTNEHHQNGYGFPTSPIKRGITWPRAPRTRRSLFSATRCRCITRQSDNAGHSPQMEQTGTTASQTLAFID